MSTSPWRYLRCAEILATGLLFVFISEDTRAESIDALKPPGAMPLESSTGWRSARCCGPNALYAFLKLHGVEVTRDEVLALAPPAEDGVSLGALRDAAVQLGLPTKVVRSNPHGLSGLSFPFVAHLSNVRSGHFVVVLGVENEDVIVADMMPATVEREPLDIFAKKWSGYALIRKDHWQTNLWLSLGLCAGIFMLALFWPRRIQSVAQDTNRTSHDDG